MLQPTPEQQAIIDLATSSKENILINALAGSAKTTTLEMIAQKLTSEPTLFLAFNKRIADEAQKRLPPHVEVKTLNALGHKVWGAVCNRRLVLKSSKMSDLYHEYLYSLKGPSRSRAWDNRSVVLDLLRQAKRDGYVPPGARSLAKWYVGEEWRDEIEDDVDDRTQAVVCKLLTESITMAYDGIIDFDDQLYMPVCFGAQWPKYSLILLDEAQDLSPINHEMIQALFYKRLIAVGDPWQSIYAFRGSVFNGMSLLQKRFSMREMQLSVTFRVPCRGVERARSRVPHYQWPLWIEDWPLGNVITLGLWSEIDVPPNSAILCRNNAPLFSCALSLLSAGRNIKLVGMDIGPGLLRILKKLGQPSATNLKELIATWETTEQEKSKNVGRVADKAECLRALCTNRSTLAEAIRWTEDLFKQEGDIQLLSGHKAKGLEWNTVFHLDPWRIPSRYATGEEELEQEKNVRYVIETRFKKDLFLVDMEGFRR